MLNLLSCNKTESKPDKSSVQNETEDVRYTEIDLYLKDLKVGDTMFVGNKDANSSPEFYVKLGSGSPNGEKTTTTLNVGTYYLKPRGIQVFNYSANFVKQGSILLKVNAKRYSNGTCNAYYLTGLPEQVYAFSGKSSNSVNNAIEGPLAESYQCNPGAKYWYSSPRYKATTLVPQLVAGSTTCGFYIQNTSYVSSKEFEIVITR